MPTVTALAGKAVAFSVILLSLFFVASGPAQATPPLYATSNTMATGKDPEAAILADLRNNGILDLIVANKTDGTVSVYLGNGDGTFQSPTVYPADLSTGAILTDENPDALAVADLNGDDIPDLIIGELGTYATSGGVGGITVLFGKGDGTFYTTSPSYTDNSGLQFGGAPLFGAITTANVGGTNYIFAGKTNNAAPNNAAVCIVKLNADGTVNPAGTCTGNSHSPQAIAFLNAGGTFVVTADGDDNNITVWPVSLGAGSPGFSGLPKTYAAGASGSTLYTLALADFNGDGKLDIATTDSNENLDILTGNGDGTFNTANSFGISASPQAIAVGKIAGGANPDVLVGGGASNVLVVMKNSTTAPGTFSAGQTIAVGNNPRAVAVGDLNGDGHVDAVAANSNDNTASVFMGNSKGTLLSLVTTYPTQTNPVYVVATPLGSGFNDIAVANKGSNSVSVFDNKGDGSFGAAANYTVGSQPVWLASGDIAGNGKNDLVTANYSGGGAGTVSVLPQGTGGAFGTAKQYNAYASSGLGPTSLAVGDINGDGKADVIVANYLGNSEIDALYADSNGDGGLQAATQIATGSQPRTVALVPDISGGPNPDIMFYNAGIPNVSFLPSNGNGTFGTQQNFNAPEDACLNPSDVTNIVAADFVLFALKNPPDILLGSSCNTTNQMDVMLGQGMQSGAYRFVTLTAGTAPEGVAVANLHAANDLVSDIVTANNGNGTSINGSVAVLLGTGGVTFNGPYTFYALPGVHMTSVAVADFNGDNLPDIVATDAGHNQIVVLTHLNPQPALGFVNQALSEDGSASGTFSASDGFSRTLSYSALTQPANGTVTVNSSTGAYTYTPNSGFVGTDSFTWSASTTGSSYPNTESTGTAYITVNAVPPVANNGTVTVGESTTGEGGTLSATNTAGAPALTYSIVANGAHGTVTLTNSATGAFTYTPAGGFTGTDTFTFSVTNTQAISNTATETVNVVPPPTPSAGSVTATENTPVTGTLSASNPCNCGTLDFSANNGSHGIVAVTNATTGAFTYTPTSGYAGTDSFTFTVSNGYAASAPATVTVTVSNLSAANVNLTVNEDAQTTGSITVIDPCGCSTLSYSVSTAAIHGVASINASTGAFNYSPVANYTGADSFVVTVSNGSTSTTATVSITVNPVPPVASNESLTTYAGQTLSGQLIAVASNGHALMYAAVTQPAHGTLTLTASTGAFTYTPTSGYTGSDSFTFNANDGTTTSNTATVSITVSAVPVQYAAPVASNESLSDYTGQTLNGQLSAVASNGHALSYAAVTQPAHGTLTLTASTGAFTYTPTAGYTGSDSFMFNANDGTTTSNTATVSITVNAVPVQYAAPVASNESLSDYTGQTLNGQLSAVASNGHALTYAAVTQPAHGTLTLTASTGAFTYTPTAGYTGSDSFTFNANDGTTTSNTATVTISVNAVPVQYAAPVASNENLSDYTGQTLSGQLSAVASNGHALTYAAVTQPAHGTLTLTASTGAFTYTPTTGFTGSDSFTFNANDGTTTSNTATVSLTVNAVPVQYAAPVSSNESLTTYAGQTLSGQLIAVASNGHALTYAAVTQPVHGTLTLTASTGTFTYTSTLGYTGSDSFTFNANDGTTTSNTATVSITVNAVPVQYAVPVASNESLSDYTGQTLSGQLSAVASNGHALTYAAVTQPAHGTLTLTASTGAFTYTPASGYTGSDSFTFNANDGTTTSNTATVTIKVNAVPVAPPPPPPSGGSSGGGGGFGLLSLLLLVPLVRLRKKKL